MRAFFLVVTAVLSLSAGCASSEPFEVGAACGACSTLLSAGFCYGCCTGDSRLLSGAPGASPEVDPAALPVGAAVPVVTKSQAY